MEPKYIPDGYIEVAHIKSNSLTTISYTDESGAVVLFSVSPFNASVGVSKCRHGVCIHRQC